MSTTMLVFIIIIFCRVTYEGAIRLNQHRCAGAVFRRIVVQLP